MLMYAHHHASDTKCRYDILGTTLTDSAPSNDMSLDLIPTDLDAQANICLSCPPMLLQVIRDVSSQHYAGSNDDNARLVSVVDAFTPHLWASSLQHVSSTFDLSMRTHIGCAYKSAVKIYITRSSSSTSTGPATALEDLVADIITHLEHVPPSDPYFKATCWPSFIAGAETDVPARRNWVAARFEVALKTLPWGYLASAVDLLEEVWARKAKKENEGAGARWLVELKVAEGDWLIA